MMKRVVILTLSERNAFWCKHFKCVEIMKCILEPALWGICLA